ncbi:uncharacterized protein Triagg1_6044 [Trichoderma aggressivum f. europaeum]|uniref:26S proteasome complex subunit SEM1 n=1 Tax=Trichoderma aggressivum f. europaeum TaxID=173218 RepID=A0AAE1IDJ7_9HYPO|nr:hypothetical protein Triagg1_6044 [Trichoderma aggressivum f. europaeum]
MASTTTEPKVAEPEQSTSNDQQKPEQKHLALGEDDEFEDFPIDDWPADQTEAAQRNGETKHLWEESWDDDDTSDDFSNQLKWVVGSLLVSTLLLTALSLDFRPRRRFR